MEINFSPGEALINHLHVEKTFFFSPCNRMGDDRGFQGETWPPAASIIALQVEKKMNEITKL